MHSLELTIALIRDHHRQARFAMKQQSKMDRSLEAFFRVNVSGFSTGDDEVSRAKASKAAIAAIEAARANDADPFHAIVTANDAARKPFDKIRSSNELSMAKLSRQLPAHTFVAATRGFGEKGFAQIVGEAGDLANYATVSKLWKRLGLAVMDGRRQGNPGSKASADDWIAHGYSGERRSILWNISQSLFKAQSGADPLPYRVVYDERKAYEQERNEREGLGLTKGHIHNRAMRYVEKRLVRDLWRAWRQATKSLSDRTNMIMPAANTNPAQAGDEAMRLMPSGQASVASSTDPVQAGGDATSDLSKDQVDSASPEDPSRDGGETTSTLLQSQRFSVSPDVPASAGDGAKVVLPQGQVAGAPSNHEAVAA